MDSKNFTVLIPMSCWNSWRLHPTRRAFLTFESFHARLTRNSFRHVIHRSEGHVPEGTALSDGLDLPVLCHHVFNLLQLLYGSRSNLSKFFHLIDCITLPSQSSQHCLGLFYSSNLNQPPGQILSRLLENGEA